MWLKILFYFTIIKKQNLSTTFRLLTIVSYGRDRVCAKKKKEIVGKSIGIVCYRRNIRNEIYCKKRMSFNAYKNALILFGFAEIEKDFRTRLSILKLQRV